MASAVEPPFFIDKNALPVMKSEHRISSLGHAIRAEFPGRSSGSSLPEPPCAASGEESLCVASQRRHAGGIFSSPLLVSGRRSSAPNYRNFARVPSRTSPALPRHLGEAGSGPEILRDLIQIDFIREIAYET